MSISISTKSYLDATSTQQLLKTINDSSDSTGSPFHGLIDANGNQLTFGQATPALSIPVALAVPTIATSSSYAHTASTTAYAFGQLWANNATAGSVTFNTISVAKANNQAFTITGGLLKKSGITTTNAAFRIHLFNAAPTTAVADYGTFQANVTMANYIGSLDTTINEGGSDNSFGALIPTIGSNICATPVSGAQTIYFVPEVRAAYTPVSAETLTLSLYVQ